MLPDCDVWGNLADPRDDFIATWPEVQKPLQPAFDPADVLPLVQRHPLTSERWPSEADATYRRAVGVCYWLATVLDDDGRFFLSCRTLGDLLDVSHTQAATLLRRARQEGLLQEREKGGPNGRATRFPFDLDAVGFAETAQDARTHPARRAVGEGA